MCIAFFIYFFFALVRDVQYSHWVDNKRTMLMLNFKNFDYKGLFTLMPFSTLPNFGKVAKKMATFSLLLNFGNYIRNPTKILV